MVYKITIAQLIIVFVGCLILKKDLDNVSTIFIDNIYSNATAPTNPNDSELTFGQTVDMYRDLYNDYSEDHSDHPKTHKNVQAHHANAKMSECKEREQAEDESWFDWSAKGNSPYSVNYKKYKNKVIIERKQWITITKQMTKT
jgi:hypothetical protein